MDSHGATEITFERNNAEIVGATIHSIVEAAIIFEVGLLNLFMHFSYLLGSRLCFAMKYPFKSFGQYRFWLLMIA
jgi:hypothetical protein